MKLQEVVDVFVLHKVGHYYEGVTFTNSQTCLMKQSTEQCIKFRIE